MSGRFDFKLSEEKLMTKYITRLETVVNQLSRNRESLSANQVMENILRSLTDDFKNIVCIIGEWKDLSMLSVEELVGSLETHEQKGE